MQTWAAVGTYTIQSLLLEVAYSGSTFSNPASGAAWRNPKVLHLEPIADMIRGVKALGLETCVTLGMLEAHQAERLRDAGLDYYNHNIDTSPEFYGQIISMRTYQDRLDTLEHVREADHCGQVKSLR